MALAFGFIDIHRLCIFKLRTVSLFFLASTSALYGRDAASLSEVEDRGALVAGKERRPDLIVGEEGRDGLIAGE